MKNEGKCHMPQIIPSIILEVRALNLNCKRSRAYPLHPNSSWNGPARKKTKANSVIMTIGFGQNTNEYGIIPSNKITKIKEQKYNKGIKNMEITRNGLFSQCHPLFHKYFTPSLPSLTKVRINAATNGPNEAIIFKISYNTTCVEKSTEDNKLGNNNNQENE